MRRDAILDLGFGHQTYESRRTAVSETKAPTQTGAEIRVPAASSGAGMSQDVTPSQERLSWGRYPRVEHRGVTAVTSRAQAIDFKGGSSFLPYGQGRSYGDSCLNADGVLLETAGLHNLLAFDETTGLLTCESGVTLAEVLEFAVPRGWFLPTTPGTKYVSVGGAIGNDIHGKNHHRAGAFGRHVPRFELLRSDGELLTCSASENSDLYRATIGGLGLTGLILQADVQLKPVPGPFIAMESIRFRSLDEFFEVSEDADRHFEYTMSFVDCMAAGEGAGRGLFMGGNHAWQKRIPGIDAKPKQRLALPIDLPEIALNSLSVRAFNWLLYHKQLAPVITATVPFDPFFYPLDSIKDWNRMYGKRGFLQHQCVLPHEAARQALEAMFNTIKGSGQNSFLAVLKTFGDLPSPGMMSFPRPGATLALDFPVRGEATLKLLDRLDDIAIACGGAVYPAKDARMSQRTFEASFPRWREFAEFIDPKFSSSFWRRVTAGLDPRVSS
ncbi:MAG TPA: FAD-binding oxidoreductase [Dehalococcoidia bacterium]|nr:FAD-binding oxidoreductase [Dehalococcoidia bacterium]